MPNKKAFAERTPEELALIRQAKQRLQKSFRWTEPQAFSCLRSMAMLRQQALTVVATSVLQASPEQLAALVSETVERRTSSPIRKTRRDRRTGHDAPPAS
jgi:hypothetical protein